MRRNLVQRIPAFKKYQDLNENDIVTTLETFTSWLEDNGLLEEEVLRKYINSKDEFLNAGLNLESFKTSAVEETKGHKYKAKSEKINESAPGANINERAQSTSPSGNRPSVLDNTATKQSVNCANTGLKGIKN